MVLDFFCPLWMIFRGDRTCDDNVIKFHLILPTPKNKIKGNNSETYILTSLLHSNPAQKVSSIFSTMVMVISNHITVTQTIQQRSSSSCYVSGHSTVYTVEGVTVV